MSRYRKINVSEYKMFPGDVAILGEYPKNNMAQTISYKIAKNVCNVIVFNLRESLKGVLKQELKKEKLEDLAYIDEKENIDINYIEDKCYELKNTMDRFHIVIDYSDKIKCTNDNLSQRLKRLSSDLNVNILVTPDLTNNRKNKKHLTLDNLKDKELIDFADCILLITEDEAVIAKNAYGKTGIITKWREDYENGI